MIKLIQALQQSPELIQTLVRDHLNNDDITEFFSTQDFLSKVNLLLQRVDDVPFFIKYVFRIMREPQPSEIIILKGYLEVSRDESIKKLVEYLLESQQTNQKQKLTNYLEKLRDFVEINNAKEFKALLQQCPEPEYASCIQLFLFVDNIGEDTIWKNNQYKLKMLKFMDLAFERLQRFQQSIQLYLSVLAILLIKTLTTKLDDFSILVLLIKNSTKYPQLIRKVIQNWQKSIISEIPCHVLSSAIFSYYTQLFDHQIYFKQNLTEIIEVKNLCEQVYDLIMSDFSFEQLGWISIFSIDKWISHEISEDAIYKCVAFLRENYFYRSDIISQILVLNISRALNQSFLKFVQIYETLLSILTPKQLKYLIFKLDQTLQANLKQQIILSAVREKSQNLCILAFYFAQSSQLSKQILQQANQLKNNQINRWIDVADNIKKSSYNSLQKEIINFKDIYRFWFCFELNCVDNKPAIKISSYAAFFKDLFTNDYFSEQFWLCEEKIRIFFNTKQPYQQKLDAIFEFLLYEKIYNLSGIMILNELIREGINIDYTFSKKQLEFLQTFIEFCLKILKRQIFISNVTIILDYLLLMSELSISVQAIEFLLNYFKNEKRKHYYKINQYTKISYNSEAIIINLLQKINKVQQMHKYSQHTGFFTMNIQFIEGPRQYRQKIAKLYHCNRIKLGQRYDYKQLVAYKEARKLILNQMHPQYLKTNISKISEVFQFYCPLYSGQIVVLTNLARSPQENFYFRNHYIPFIYQEYAKIYALAAEKIKYQAVHLAIFNCALDLLNQVLNGDTFSHGLHFYKSLNKSQLVYTLLSNKNLEKFNNQQVQQIVHVCLRIIQKDNYPLLRQYISVTFCRAYLLIVKRDLESPLRQQLIEMMRVNINIGVPIALTLGYELIQSLKVPPQNEQVLLEIKSIHQLLVKFISCHTAYLRAICQYYLYLYLDIVDPKDQFLTNLKHFWKDDKDSQKILTNVSMVVEGFKEGVQRQCDFLGFQRVEEYPTNRLKMEFYCSTAKFYSEFVLNQYSEKDFPSQEMFDAINQATTQRYEHLKANYLLQLESFTTNQTQRTSKSNIKKVIKQKKAEPLNKQKPKKEDNNKNKKGKHKQKVVQAAKQTIKQLQLKDLPRFKIQANYRLLQSKQQLSRWYRSNVDPKIIVIAALLEKVHNFGHILRTLHRKNAMVVVPSVQPLLHPQCKQLVPNDCDVQIVEIRHRDLQKFITLMKSLGYPLVALQQCSRSVMVQQANFPQKFMMLLGNERIGAPSALLNEGDLLVEIPQIGKIRSLNVHVSMVICLWEFLNR